MNVETDNTKRIPKIANWHPWNATPDAYGVGYKDKDEDGQTIWKHARANGIPEDGMSFLEAEEVKIVAYESLEDGETYGVIDMLGHPIPKVGPANSELRLMIEEME